MTVEEIIKSKSNRLSSVPDAYTNDIDSFQKQVYKELIKLFDQLETNNGKIVFSKKNLVASAKITEKLKQVMNGKEYYDIVNSFLNEFDSQAKLSDDFFKKEFGALAETELQALLLEKNKANTLELLSGSSVDVNFIQPIKGAIDTAISSNSSLSEAIKIIQNIAVGNDEAGGKLLTYSKQISKNSFSFNDRGYTKLTSDSYGIEWYRFSGGTLADTRCFCDERVGKYFHIKEIQAWGDGKNIGDCKSGTHWQGAYKNTNASNIFTVLGGYNCEHDLLPVSLRSVPKDVLLRNIKSGNFVPTEVEKKLLKL